MRFQPQYTGADGGIDPGLLPPCAFIAAAVKFAMVAAVERHGELVAYPMLCVHVFAALGSELLGFKKQILDFDRMIMAWHRSNQTSKRLNCIPGVGPLLATALVAGVADPKVFRSGRNFSARIGLVPKQHACVRSR
jgi:transposase